MYFNWRCVLESTAGSDWYTRDKDDSSWTRGAIPKPIADVDGGVRGSGTSELYLWVEPDTGDTDEMTTVCRGYIG